MSGVLDRFENGLERLIPASSRGRSAARCSPSRSRAPCAASWTTRPRSSAATGGWCRTTSSSSSGAADHDRLEGLGRTAADELAAMLREHAAQQPYLFSGPVRVVMEARRPEDRRLPRASSAVSKSSLATGDPTAPQVRRATATLEVDGRGYALAPPGIVIGRGSDADLASTTRASPASTSRSASRRPRTRRTPRITVLDLGSTNGMFVDGKRVERAASSMVRRSRSATRPCPCASDKGE